MTKHTDSSAANGQDWAKYEDKQTEELELLTSDGLKVEVKGVKEENEVKICGVLELFRFADGYDKLLIAIGLFCATINGIGAPVWVVVFGEMTKSFIGTGAYIEYLSTVDEYLQSINKTSLYFVTNPSLFNCSEVLVYYGGNKTCFAEVAQKKILEEMARFAIIYCIVAVVVMFVSYGQFLTWLVASERQALRIRRACLLNILRQNIGWFDTHSAAELSTRLADDVHKIQEGIGDKMAVLWQWMVSAVFCLIVGFVYGWKLTLVVLAPSPLLVFTTALFSKLASTITSRSLAVYAKAGSVAEEVFGAIRTVIAFGGQEKEVQRYRKHLSAAEAFGRKKGFSNGISMGFAWCIVFCMFALSFWYGAKLFREDDNYDANNVLIVTFGILTGAFAVGIASPNFEIIATARGAAYTIFELIDMKSSIDSYSEKGIKPYNLTGRVRFEDVYFHYPSRPDVKVLDGLSLEAKQGQTVAVVGSSGCGKSTVVQLLLRFYDPLQGKVLIDGHDIKDINLKWLREHIGVVSQEPVLFATTIKENIMYGKEGITMEEIEEATKSANAYDFIMKLPDKFETLVGERGAQLSGGQKQRLAIARALVADPKILLLDEATSALDMESESIVQDALDKAREGRTTIVIAHRLSTIKNADIIIGMNNGKVEEVGTHDELMRKEGHYYRLVMNQQTDTAEEDPEDGEFANDNPFQVTSAAKLGTSHTSIFEEEAVTDKEDKDLPEASFMRIMRINASEWLCLLIGCFSSIVNGGAWPTFGIIFAQVVTAFSLMDIEKQEREMMKCALIFAAIGVTSLVTHFLQCYFFGRSGEALTRKLRDMSFQSMLKQDVSWFDDPKNNVGALITRLATDAVVVQGVTGHRLGSTMTNVSSLALAIVVAFVHGWQMTLLVIGLSPLIILCGVLNMKIIAGHAGKNREALERAGKMAVESIGNIRTVAGLTIEQKFVNFYMENLEIPFRNSRKGLFFTSIVYGISQGITFVVYAVSFGFGAYKIEQGDMVIRDVFVIYCAIMFGCIGLGFESVLAPDVGKAQTSARRIFQIIDSEPLIDHTSKEGQKLSSDYDAAVTFKDVSFSYPNRRTVRVLRHLNLSVSPGQTVALVGTSGCGKSTSMQLIERFYDCTYGQVALDSQDLRSLNIRWLREQIGIVSQEPVLFDASIAENIAYGDNKRTVPMEEIISAARHANIHTFIKSLPKGYDTNVGLKGTQLSGGQKQRIAIARALVRNPKILLLDEATSALDTESEKIVQEALDKAREGRTSIVIAHRLSTVQNADKIFVISHGRVVESGTHNELMARQDIYFKLVKKSIKE